jgi:beta-galactosidase/beta-glucuronidase
LHKFNAAIINSFLNNFNTMPTLTLFKSNLMRIALISGILFYVLNIVTYAQSAIPPESELYPRPTIIPKTVKTEGVQKTIISLNGTWKLNSKLAEEFWSNSVDFSSWSDVRVPSHIAAQGFSAREAQQYAYKLNFLVPADFAGKRIFIKFHGVTGMAKAWINGTYLKEHFGGFTTWDCDITEYVTPGQESVLTVGIDDIRRGLSGYNNGGILRDVELMAVPQDYITRLNIETDLDENYDHAVLKIWIAMAFNQGNASQINFTLLDASGKAVPLDPYNVTLTKESPEKIIEIPISSPVKWDAEHPNLYNLEAKVVQDDKTTQSVSKNVGISEKLKEWLKSCSLMEEK